MNYNMSGKIWMSPKRLYEMSLASSDLEGRIDNNFQKMNNAFEGVLQAVRTPELHQRVIDLYDLFKQIEANFNSNTKNLNDFLTKKLNEYNEHASNVAEASGSLSSNLDFTPSNTVGSVADSTVRTDVIGNTSFNEKGAMANDNVSNNNTSANNNVNKQVLVNDGPVNDGVISLDPRERGGFNVSDR